MIYFLIYLFLEILISSSFSSHFGAFMMFLEVIGSFLFGLFLVKNLNLSFVENIQRVVTREITQQEFISIGLFRLVGAILLMIPGVLTDIIGLLMQFEEVGSFIGKRVFPMQETRRDNFTNDDIIDVEIIGEKKDDRNS